MVKKKHNTAHYFKGDYDISMKKSWMSAKYWEDPETREIIKIPPLMKILYSYRYDRYLAHAKAGIPYKETHTQCAEIIGFFPEKAKGIYTTLMKRMGLMESWYPDSPRNTEYIMRDVKFVKGRLFNDDLEKYISPDRYNGKFTKKVNKIIKENKYNIDVIKSNLKKKWIIMTEEEYNKLKGGEAD